MTRGTATRKSTKEAGKTRSPRISRTSRSRDGDGLDGVAPDMWNLRLYVAGQTPKSIAAFSNLKRICEEHLKGRYTIEVVDLLKDPQLAQGDQILAIPTLVRKLPSPMKKMIGDLSNTERFLVGFDLKPA